MDDATAGYRLKTLQAEITQLKARAAELADTISTEPAMPEPGTTETIQDYLTDVINGGTPAERKAAIEALIAEIRISDEGVIPVFRIPAPRTPADGERTATDGATSPVRAMVRSVGRVGLEPTAGGL